MHSFQKKMAPSISGVPGLGIAFLLALPTPAPLLGAPRVRETRPRMPQYEETSDI